MNNQFILFLQALAISIGSGYLFTFLHVPLSWMLGPLFAVSIWQLVTKKSLSMPTTVFNSALLLFGYTLGASFTRETALEVLHHFPFMIVTTLLMILLSIGMGLMIIRNTNLDKNSVLVGSVPGGLSQMLIIGQEMKGANLSVIVFLQVIRILLVVLFVPFLTVYGIEGNAVGSQVPIYSAVDKAGPAYFSTYFLFGCTAVVGFLGGKRLGLPTSVLTGPILLIAFLAILTGREAPALPPMILILAQIAMGMNIGMKVKPDMLGNQKKLGLLAVGSSVLLVLFSFILAYVLTHVTPMKLSTAFLGAAPGGIAEMGMTAAVVNADLSLVSAYQLFRVLFILFIFVPLLKRYVYRHQHNNVVFEEPSTPTKGT
ncbi:AbrB family transcriptional regulator [Bacillus sp. B15-48]|uniref:AbrB family transcriptional regulator n=1 Tax=Bacillus sp. B15-48 TaxID=1548601 RepID=UPI00193F680C|nr:AbrB family transcriptional regulator [Bacillus sp. B15-48]MBM4761753.1 AbrB family transcriptional regulator [Bacillus sp. B15-48]